MVWPDDTFSARIKSCRSDAADVDIIRTDPLNTPRALSRLRSKDHASGTVVWRWQLAQATPLT